MKSLKKAIVVTTKYVTRKRGEENIYSGGRRMRSWTYHEHKIPTRYGSESMATIWFICDSISFIVLSSQ